jgi:hypothetical protein
LHRSIDPAFAKLIRGCWFATVVVISERSPEQIHKQIRELFDSLYRVHSGRILATQIRLLGDFDLAGGGDARSRGPEIAETRLNE